MGGDGGTISSKRKYLRTTALGKRKAQGGEDNIENNHNTILHKLSTCAISSEPLKEPIVGCKLGNLYNKQDVIKYLLMDKNVRKEKYGKAFVHIRKLKDVVELTFQKNNNVANKGTSPKTTSSVPPTCWVCPVTNITMNCKIPFCFLWSSGNVYSMKAIKELPSACDDGNTSNLIKLAPTNKEMNILKEQLKNERATKKKDRKKQKLSGKI
jgi:hypothetical protein